MSIKRMLMLASMALAAILFAAPAAAQAEWTHDHEPLDHHAELTLEGFVKFELKGVGGYGCNVHGTLTIEPGSGGQVTSFAPTTETCVGTEVLADCVLVHDTADVPWDAHAITKSGDIMVTNATIFYVYQSGSCAVPSIGGSHLIFPAITMTPVGNHTTIDQIQLSGQDILSGAIVTGTLNVTPAGTYGINTE